MAPDARAHHGQRPAMDTRTDNETEDTFEIVADQISHKDRGERRACCGYASDWRKASGTLIEVVPVV